MSTSSSRSMAICACSIVALLAFALAPVHECHRRPEEQNSTTKQQQLHDSSKTTTTSPPPPPLEPLKPFNTHKKASPSSRSFTIDYSTNSFVKDGVPFRYVSGSIHYFRVPQAAWRERLLAARLGGLNTIQTYIEWSSHEPQENVFDFSGMLNFTEYFRIAQELGLNVIVRLGPFIASERDNMGLPYWLPAKHPDIYYRTSDKWYMYYVQRWYQVLLPKLIPYLYENGGPVIMAQVENEYGSWAVCDEVYTTFLRDLFRSYLGPDFLLFTVDGGYAETYLQCTIDSVYPTVDFGTGYNVSIPFHLQRLAAPEGPLANSEYYPGWFDTWGEEHQTVGINDTVTTLDAMLAANASVNIYMYHGGTSFDFMNGALASGNYFRAMTTSYDYDAPISDVGFLTPKYFAIRNVIQKYFADVPELSLKDSEVIDKIRLLSSGSGVSGTSTTNGDVKTGKFEKTMPLSSTMAQESTTGKRLTNLTVTATQWTDLFELIGAMSPIEAVFPLSFEALSQRAGFVYYQTQVPFRPSDPIALNVPILHDRALVFVNNIYRATLSRMDNINASPLNGLQFNDTLGLFVENQGHTCCARTAEQKGIIANVTLGGLVLQHWRHYPLFHNWTEAINGIETLGRRKQGQPLVRTVRSLSPPPPLYSSFAGQTSAQLDPNDCACALRDIFYVPTVYVAKFTLDDQSARHTDLYLDTSGCGRKGQAFMNGFNLGRYWPVMGPQITLYIPRSTLFANGENTLVLFELERDSRPCLTVHLTEKHIINGTTPHNYAVIVAARQLKEQENANKTKAKVPHIKKLGVPDGYFHPHQL